MIALYAILVCNPAVKDGCRPQMRLFDRAKDACVESVKSTVYPTAVFVLEIKPTDECFEKKEKYFEECLDWIEKPPFAVSLWKCEPTPDYTLRSFP